MASTLSVVVVFLRTSPTSAFGALTVVVANGDIHPGLLTGCAPVDWVLLLPFWPRGDPIDIVGQIIVRGPFSTALLPRKPSSCTSFTGGAGVQVQSLEKRLPTACQALFTHLARKHRSGSCVRLGVEPTVVLGAAMLVSRWWMA